MTLAGFVCEVSDEKVSFEDCIQCSIERHPCHYSESILRGMSRQQEERKDAGISVTTCLGCLRKGYYAVATPFYQKPSRLFPAYRGTLTHLLMEQGQVEGKICEVRFAIDLDGVTLTGKPDEYDPTRKLLVDYKTKKEMPTDVPSDYADQLNAYRLLLQEGYNLSTGEQARYDVSAMGLIFITMMEVRKFPVPIIDTKWVRESMTGRLHQIQEAMAGGELPLRQVPEPYGSVFCRDWCPHVRRCIEDGE